MNASKQAVKTAGMMFLLCFIVPTLNWVFGLYKLVVIGDPVATVNNIMADQMLFRVGLGVELAMAIGLIVLATSLYLILKPVNKNLALFALLLKMAEAVIVAAIVLVYFIVLQLVAGETGPVLEQLKAPMGVLFNTHAAIHSIPMVFLGLDMMLFSYLFLKSNFIPKPLAVFGIISFACIFVHSFGTIVAPEYAGIPIVAGLLYTPSGIFELVIGTWLLVKGIKGGK